METKTKVTQQGKRTNIIYGNFILRDRFGRDLCRVTEKRAHWYLDRDLGVLVSEEPPIVQLNFDTKGFSVDSFTLEPKENQCVVCGTKELSDLTKHHVVPYEYRKHFPLVVKSRSSHDIVIVCNDHHSEYEGEHAIHLKRKLLNEVEEADKRDPGYKKRKKLKIASEFSKLLLDDQKNIPLDRFMELVKRIEKYIKKEVTFETLEELADLHIKLNENKKADGQLIVEKIENLQDFVIMWRQHFVDTMKPKFLPKGWEIERDINNR